MPHKCTDCGRAFEDGSKEMLSGCPDCGGTTFQFRPEGGDTSTEEPAEPPETPDADVDGVARTVGNAASTVRSLVESSGSPDVDNRGSDGGPGGLSPGTDGSDGAVETGRASDTDDPIDIGQAGDGWPGGDGFGTDESDTEDAPDGTTACTDDTPSDARDDIVEADELPDGQSPRDRPPVPDPRPLSARLDEEESRSETAEATGAENAESVPGGPEERPSLSELRAELNDQFESIRVVAPGRYELNLMELYDREEYIIALQEDGKYTVQLPERWDER